MRPRRPRPVLAIAQPAMHWGGDDNTRGVIAILAHAAGAGADICMFPELAITGYHRQIGAVSQPEHVDRWLADVAAACARHGIATAIGAPTFGDDGRIFNSHVFIDAAGAVVGRVEKKGLTAAEATFFAPGRVRDTVELQGLRCTGVICREVEDFAEVCADLEAHAPELIFWPGLMGPEPGTEHIDPPLHVRQAQRLAARLGAHVVQSNWPVSLNYPERSANAGKSVVIGPSGEIAFTLPEAEAGLAIFILGSEDHVWQRQLG